MMTPAVVTSWSISHERHYFWTGSTWTSDARLALIHASIADATKTSQQIAKIDRLIHGTAPRARPAIEFKELADVG